MPLRPLPSAPCLRMTPDNTCHTGVARERCHRLLRLSERRSHAVFHPYPARLTSPFTSPCHRTFPQASPATGPPYHTKNATVAASSPSAAVPSEPPSSSPYQAGSPSSTRACATAPAASCRLSHRRSSRHHTRARCGDQPGARPPHKWNGPRRPLRPQARPNRPARPFRELGRTLATTRDPVWLTDAVWPCAYSPRCCAI
jgi:hypothetical protein